MYNNFSAIRYSTSLVILRNHDETLKPSNLPSKERLVSCYSQFLTICLFLNRCRKERQRKVYEDRLSCSERFAFFLCTAIPNFAQKKGLNLGLEQWIVNTVILKHSKQLMHVKRASVLAVGDALLLSRILMSVLNFVITLVVNCNN